MASTSSTPPTPLPITGLGFKRKIAKVKHKGTVYKKQIKFMGSGYNETKSEYVQLNKFMINYEQLVNKNIVSLKYINTRQSNSKINKQLVSDDIKFLIIDFIKTNKLNKVLYEKMKTKDQDWIYDFFNAVHINVGIQSNKNDEVMKQYEILIGEYESGNNSPAVTNKLKVYINDFVRQKRISLEQGLTMIAALS